MESNSTEKSRKQKRKEARLAKQQNRFSSWIQHQKAKSERSHLKPNSEITKKSKSPRSKVPEGRDDRDSDVDGEEDGSIKQPPMPIAKEKNELKKGKSKTKFEEYLKMDMQKGVVSAEEDLELERKLAKKLKVKSGKLRGVDDGMNILFDGISSAMDYVEDNEIQDDDENNNNVKSSKRSSVNKKGKKRKLSHASEQGPEELVVSNTAVEGVEQVDDTLAEVTPEEPSFQTPAFDGSLKYVPPHRKSVIRNESDEYTQFRRSVKGLLNRLCDESNLESTTREISTMFRTASRSIASQIISEELLSICSKVPFGNEQL